MATGRPPKPTRLKQLAGNPGKRALPADEPQPTRPAKTPPAPAHLSKAAKREWRRIAKELHALGLLTTIDKTALAAYCETYVTWIDAIAACREKGMIVKSPTGYPMQNPFLSVANQAEKRMRGWLSEFGMTPAARTRVQTVPEAEADPFESFLNSETVTRKAKKAASGE